MSYDERQEVPEWFSGAPRRLQEWYVQVGIADPRWLRDPYVGQAPEWAQWGRFISGFGFIIPGLVGMVPGMPEIAGTLAPFYAYGMGERMYRAGYVPPTMGGEDWTYAGREAYYQQRYGQLLGPTLGMAMYGYGPTPYRQAALELTSSQIAYWGAQEAYTPTALAWSVARLASYEIPGMGIVRALGFPGMAAIQQQRMAEAMLPNLMAGLNVPRQPTFAGAEYPYAMERLLTSPSFWPFQVQPPLESLYGGIMEWTAYQVGVWGLREAMQAPPALRLLPEAAYQGFGPFGAAGALQIESQGVSMAARVRGFADVLKQTAAFSLIQAGAGIMMEPYQALLLRSAMGVPFTEQEWQRFGIEEATGGGLVGAGVMAGLAWGFGLGVGGVGGILGVGMLGEIYEAGLADPTARNVTRWLMREQGYGQWGPTGFEAVEGATPEFRRFVQMMSQPGGFVPPTLWGAPPGYGRPQINLAEVIMPYLQPYIEAPRLQAYPGMAGAPQITAEAQRLWQEYLGRTPLGPVELTEEEYEALQAEWRRLGPEAFGPEFAPMLEHQVYRREQIFAQRWARYGPEAVGPEYAVWYEHLGFIREEERRRLREAVETELLAGRIGPSEARAWLVARGYDPFMAGEIVRGWVSDPYRGRWVRTAEGYWQPEEGPMYRGWLEERERLLERMVGFRQGQGIGPYAYRGPIITGYEGLVPPTVAPSPGPYEEYSEVYAQAGLDQVFTRPTRITVAERGAERVTVTPDGLETRLNRLEAQVQGLTRRRGSKSALAMDLMPEMAKQMRDALAGKGR